MGAWDGVWFMVCCFVDFGGVSSALPEFIVVVYPVFIYCGGVPALPVFIVVVYPVLIVVVRLLHPVGVTAWVILLLHAFCACLAPGGATGSFDFLCNTQVSQNNRNARVVDTA